MIANSSPKNIGAITANSTAAEPRRLRRNRRIAFLTKAVEGIETFPRRQRISTRKNYLKVIVEVFREIEAEWPAPLTGR
jgi:hypothetical protein